MIKRRYLVVLVFFMFLYIGPANLLPSSVPLAIVQQPQDPIEQPSIVAVQESYVLAADSDDDCWESPYPESGEPAHRIDAAYEYVAYYNYLNQSALQWRFQLDIPKDSTITDANISLYVILSLETSPHTMYLRRINEDDVGSLEDDSDMPDAVETNKVTVENPALGNNYWLNINITDLVQDQVNLAGWITGQYIGFRLNNSAFNEDSYLGIEDFDNEDSHHSYLNVTYTSGAGGNPPENTVTPTCSNLDDTDNMYPSSKEYQITVNTTDPDGFDAIDYVELSLWTNSRGAELWRVRFDEDTETFTEQYDPNNMITLNLTDSTNSSSGNNVNVTFYISLHNNHTAAWDIDAKQYVIDNETTFDTDWYEVDWDLGPEIDWLTGYNRRKSHTIAQTTGTGENYTVPFWVYFDAPPSMNDNDNEVGLNSSAELDFGDVRWTGSDGTTLFDYNLNLTEDYGGDDYYTNEALKFDHYPGCYPGAWYYNDRTYIVYHGPTSQEAGNIAGDPYILYYDHENETWSDTYKIGTNPLDDDSHGAPAMWINNTGHIHVVWGAHNSILKHSVSTTAEDITSWTSVDDLFSQPTYPHISYDSDNNVVHVYCREWDGHYLAYYNSTDGGHTFGSPQHVFDVNNDLWPYMEGGGGIDPYNNELLHIAWTAYYESGNHQDVFYLYVNVTTGNIYNAAGDYLGQSITVEQDLIDDCKVYDTSGYGTWGVTVHVDSSSTPYLMWGQDSASGDSTRFTYWTGSAWDTVVEVTQPRRYSAPNDFIVYSSTNITAFLADYNDMYEFDWDGNSWTQGTSMYNSLSGYQLSFSTVPHATPGGIGHHNITFQCTFTEWTSQDTPTMEAYAWGINGLLKSNAGKRAKFYVTVTVNLTEYDAHMYIYYDKNDQATTSQQLDYTTGNDPDHGDWGIEEYHAPIGNTPTNDQTPTCTNLDDTDNMYAQYKKYIVTANVSDADGFSTIDYVEIALYNNERDTEYWSVRFDEDTETFSEESDTDNMITLDVGSCSNVSSGNTLNITMVFTVHWNHTDTTNIDIRQYVRDADANSDLDWYEVNYDFETRLDYEGPFDVSDGLGTLTRGDYDKIGGILIGGLLKYYGSGTGVDRDYPPVGTVDIWISCTDVTGSPWNSTLAGSGIFINTVDSDDEVGLDTYTIKPVENGAGAGGSSLYYTTDIEVTYIADRLNIDIQADSESPLNGQQVNFTITIIYEYDSSSCTTYTIKIARDMVYWQTYTDLNYTLFNDTNSDVGYYYNASFYTGPNTHGVTGFTTNTETVTWAPIPPKWYVLPPAQLWFDIPDWLLINVAGFIFPVSWSPEFQFGYDAFFIFLGLIMIPASTMYLVRGGRKEMSMDKVFYGLIIFALGLGFLIGGILP